MNLLIPGIRLLSSQCSIKWLTVERIIFSKVYNYSFDELDQLKLAFYLFLFQEAGLWNSVFWRAATGVMIHKMLFSKPIFPFVLFPFCFPPPPPEDLPRSLMWISFYILLLIWSHKESASYILGKWFHNYFSEIAYYVSMSTFYVFTKTIFMAQQGCLSLKVSMSSPGLARYL